MKAAARALTKVNGDEQNDAPALGKLSHHFGLPLGKEWKPIMIVKGFEFAQIQSNLPKFNYFCPNATSILPKT